MSLKSTGPLARYATAARCFGTALAHTISSCLGCLVNIISKMGS